MEEWRQQCWADPAAQVVGSLTVPHPHPIWYFKREKKKTTFLSFFLFRKRTLQFSGFQFAWMVQANQHIPVFELKSLSLRKNKAKEWREGGNKAGWTCDWQWKTWTAELNAWRDFVHFLNINLSPRHPTGEGNLESTRDKRLRVKLPSSKSNRLEEAKVALRCPGGITIPEKLPSLSAPSNGDCCNPVTACAHPEFQQWVTLLTEF